MSVISIRYQDWRTEVNDHCGGGCVLQYDATHGWTVEQATGEFHGRIAGVTTDLNPLLRICNIAVETAVRAVESGQTTRLDLHVLAFAVRNSKFTDRNAYHHLMWLRDLALDDLSVNTRAHGFETTESVKTLLPAAGVVASVAANFDQPDALGELAKRIGRRPPSEYDQTFASLVAAVPADVFTLLPLRDFLEENPVRVSSSVAWSICTLAELLLPAVAAQLT